MKSILTRRSFLKATALSQAASGLMLSGCSAQLLTALDDPQTLEQFSHGVASGDPTHDSLIIWTRVKSDTPTTVIWELARDSDFRELVHQGEVNTDVGQDYCVKVDVKNLQAGKTYYYRFRHEGVFSEPGRTKTLPRGSLDKLSLAVASCSNYPFGFFNAYEVMAADQDIDFVLHLGDYIYEYGADGWGAETGQELGRNHSPAHEIVSLNDYRERHAQYKGDLSSRLLHASHPIIPTWDDHESANNPWLHGAQNHQADEGDWTDRRAASVRAYYEWMPVREPQSGLSREQLWRHFSFGDLASLITLETRHTGRSEQISYGDQLADITNKSKRDHFLSKVLGAEERNMLSAQMENFFSDSLKQSASQAQPWRMVGNQIPMARTHVPDLSSHLQREAIDGYDPVAEDHALFQRLGALDLPLYLDTWDGYPAARERFYQMCQRNDARDLLVLTGDSHSFWANQLFDDKGLAMGLELGTAGITSPGDFERYGDKGSRVFDSLLMEHNQEIVWTDCRHRGFVKVTLTPESARAEFIAVDTVMSPHYKSLTLKSMDIARRDGSLVYS